VCDLETSRMGAPYIYDISRLRVKQKLAFVYFTAENKCNCVVPVTNCGMYLFLILHLVCNVCFCILD